MNVIHSLPTNWIDMQEDLSVKKNLFPDEREKITIPLLVTMCKNLAAKYLIHKKIDILKRISSNGEMNISSFSYYLMQNVLTSQLFSQETKWID